MGILQEGVGHAKRGEGGWRLLAASPYVLNSAIFLAAAGWPGQPTAAVIDYHSPVLVNNKTSFAARVFLHCPFPA